MVLILVLRQINNFPLLLLNDLQKQIHLELLQLAHLLDVVDGVSDVQHLVLDDPVLRQN